MVPIIIRALNGEAAGREWRFEQPVVRIGRGRSNDVCLWNDAMVSDQHAYLLWLRERWFLEDCGSTNGTFIEGAGGRSSITKRIAVEPGVRFLLGGTVLAVELNSSVVPQNAGSSSGDHPATVVMGPDPRLPAPQGAGTSNQALLVPRDDVRALVLRVTLEHGELKYEFLSSRGLGRRYAIPYNRDDVSSILARLREDILSIQGGGPSFQKLHESKLQGTLTGLGSILSEVLFPRRVRRRLEGASSLFLHVYHDASLAEWPIELADIGGEPLCLRFAMGRGVITEHFDLIDSIASVGLPCGRPRLLIISDPTEDLPEAARATEVLAQRLGSLEDPPSIEFVSGARVERFETLARMNNADIVYYIGHGVYDVQSPSHSGWLLSGGSRITAQDLSRLSSPPRLVLANGCETGREPPREGQSIQAHYGLAGGILLSGVSNYIGTVWPVPEGPSAAFGGHALLSYLRGAEIGKAVLDGRIYLKETVDPGGQAWAAYTLFGDPRNNLMQGSDKPAAACKRKSG